MSATRSGPMLGVVALIVQLLIVPVTNIEKYALWKQSGGAQLQPINDDTENYHRYSALARAGRIPYRDFVIEFPPLAAALILAPGLPTPHLALYQFLFAAEMFFFNCLLVVSVSRYVARTAGPKHVFTSLAWYTLYFGFLSRLAFARFDLVPTLLAFSAVCAWSEGRPGRGGLWAGLGTLTKIFPGVIVIPATILDVGRSSVAPFRGLKSALLVVIIGVGAWGLIGGSGMVESLRFHGQRGLERGSLLGGLVMLWATLTGRPIALEFNYGSLNVAGGAAQAVAGLMLPLLVFAELLVVVITWRRRMDLMRASAAAVLGFLITNKVGSPQYLIWLLPFLPALADRTGRPARVLFTACCLAMLASSFASRFYGYLDLRVVLGYDLKNLLLVGLFALLLFGPDRRPVPAPEERAITR